ncbi:MAG TPA: methyltransferase domain-containing protein, partial [Lacipirellulaceae bacterium]|nr:methyltransferase domain-containing protein [Lacipirellulaceae bacterium]
SAQFSPACQCVTKLCVSQTMPPDDIYQEDLAKIHIDGYGFHWESAASAVLRFLRENGIKEGTIVDLGCGGGQWLERLSREGYTVCGVDRSPSMIKAAKKRVPKGTFILGSFADVDLPRCNAVNALGEPINYLDGQQSIRRVFRNVFQALRPGGIFIFDAREPATRPVEPRIHTRLADEWACISRIEEDGTKNSLVRRITTFRKVGTSYRRREELHALKLYSKSEMVRWLREAGFRVRTYRQYGKYKLAERQSAYVARKPG